MNFFPKNEWRNPSVIYISVNLQIIIDIAHGNKKCTIFNHWKACEKDERTDCLIRHDEEVDSYITVSEILF